jgi:3-methyladenine DNA glycosylase AlkD
VVRPSLTGVRKRLRASANPSDAAFLRRFFKTGPGQYAEGDKFLGIRLPELRRIAREFRGLPLEDVETLLADPWHEARLLALLLLVDAFERGTARERETIYRFYLRSAARVNNWDLVDLSAPNIIGAHLLGRGHAPLHRLAKSRNLWERRIGIVATYALIRAGDFADTLTICEGLLEDRHDLIHKACGWMLREVGKRDRVTLEKFLETHAAAMPRTMLQYAIERFSPAERARYLAMRPVSRRRRN